ncbi:MAG: GAF domain-containing protein [Anaerolineae bacterium]|nr:GAF domain-containing protein [Anaerolineae bacterium]
MMERIRHILGKWFTVQVSDAGTSVSELDAKRGRSQLLFLFVMCIIAAIVMMMDVFIGRWDFFVIALIGFAMMSALYWFTWKNQQWPRYVLLAFMVLAIPYGFRESLYTPVMIAVTLPIIVVPLIAESWLALPAAMAEMLFLFVLGMPVNWMLFILFFALGIIAWLSTSNFEQAVGTVQRAAAVLGDANRELEEGRVLLETRARELEQHARYLEAISRIAREAATQLELDALLTRVVSLLCEQFAFYNVSIFLLDPGGEWAVLRAISSKVSEHTVRVRVDTDNVMGSVVKSGKRMMVEASQTMDTSVQLDLPDTQSLLALPLRARGELIGVLDVRSAKTGVFDEQVANVLQMLADQIAVAIDNVRLFIEAREAVEAQRRAYGEVDRTAWAKLLKGHLGFGYRSTPSGVSSALDVWYPEMTQAMQQEALVQIGYVDAEGRVPVALPIKTSSGEVIGVIDTYKPGGAGDWHPDEILLLQNLSEQLGVALESARFYRESQLRAVREQIMGETTARMREPLEIEDVLKTAAEEIRRVLDMDELVVRLTPAAYSHSDHN